MSIKNDRVYLFGTCLIDSFYPSYGMDAGALLKLCGYEVTLPARQTCCGQPPYNSGHDKQALPTIKLTLETFAQDSTPLIVPSASCAAMIKNHYPRMFEANSQEHEQALKLGEKTFELIDFIHKKLPYANAVESGPLTVCLHQSCSALRDIEVAESWLYTLKSFKHVDVILPDYHTECCGFGGTFSVKSPEISATMTQDKCRNLIDTNADIIVSGDSGCLMNISTYLSKNGDITQTTHLAQFVARQFGINYEPN